MRMVQEAPPALADPLFNALPTQSRLSVQRHRALSASANILRLKHGKASKSILPNPQGPLDQEQHLCVEPPPATTSTPQQGDPGGIPLLDAHQPSKDGLGQELHKHLHALQQQRTPAQPAVPPQQQVKATQSGKDCAVAKTGMGQVGQAQSEQACRHAGGQAGAVSTKQRISEVLQRTFGIRLPTQANTPPQQPRKDMQQQQQQQQEQEQGCMQQQEQGCIKQQQQQLLQEQDQTLRLGLQTKHMHQQQQQQQQQLLTPQNWQEQASPASTLAAQTSAPLLQGRHPDKVTPAVLRQEAKSQPPCLPESECGSAKDAADAADHQLGRRAAGAADAADYQLGRHTTDAADHQMGRRTTGVADANHQLGRRTADAIDQELGRRLADAANHQLDRHTTYAADAADHQLGRRTPDAADAVDQCGRPAARPGGPHTLHGSRGKTHSHTHHVLPCLRLPEPEEFLPHPTLSPDPPLVLLPMPLQQQPSPFTSKPRPQISPSAFHHHTSAPYPHSGDHVQTKPGKTFGRERHRVSWRTPSLLVEEGGVAGTNARGEGGSGYAAGTGNAAHVPHAQVPKGILDRLAQDVPAKPILRGSSRGMRGSYARNNVGWESVDDEQGVMDGVASITALGPQQDFGAGREQQRLLRLAEIQQRQQQQQQWSNRSSKSSSSSSRSGSQHHHHTLFHSPSPNLQLLTHHPLHLAPPCKAPTLHVPSPDALPGSTHPHSLHPRSEQPHSLHVGHVKAHCLQPSSKQPHSLQPNSMQRYSRHPPGSTQLHRPSPADTQPHSLHPGSMHLHSLLPADTQPHSRHLSSMQPHCRHPGTMQRHSRHPETVQPRSLLPGSSQLHCLQPSSQLLGIQDANDAASVAGLIGARAESGNHASDVRCEGSDVLDEVELPQPLHWNGEDGQYAEFNGDWTLEHPRSRSRHWNGFCHLERQTGLLGTEEEEEEGGEKEEEDFICKRGERDGPASESRELCSWAPVVGVGQEQHANGFRLGSRCRGPGSVELPWLLGVDPTEEITQGSGAGAGLLCTTGGKIASANQQQSLSELTCRQDQSAVLRKEGDRVDRRYTKAGGARGGGMELKFEDAMPDQVEEAELLGLPNNPVEHLTGQLSLPPLLRAEQPRKRLRLAL
ncbi:hypothetical protein DUNSADRAFT_9408 [Dunaliella salina]|uniref:Uncharacterized protein n=1 Tax=Dunaliella salina TaxID=3046 RepID=A0ABQ7GHH7_DUNSA|nr:hypothetical protein DUNSADRAFT_9408 [Dunaliella salina]|eukprot:KAF5834058.1 hypothetical protein DUNSADRAFT_9408 [Dunaliella salina]